MATENLASERSVEGLAEEIKAAEGISNVAQASPFQSKDLEGKDVEEKHKEDGLGMVEASAAGSEERPGNEKIDAVAVNVKEKEAKDVQNSNSENLASDTAGKGGITTQEYDTLAVEPVVEVHEELMSHPDDTDIPEPPKEEIEKSAEDLEEPLVEVSESEAAKELEISSTVPREEKRTEYIPEISVSETDSKSEIPIPATITESTMDSITSPDDAGSAEISEVEKSFTGEHEVKCESPRELPVIDSRKVEETPDKIPEVVISENSDVVPAEASPLNELKELGEGTVTSPEVPDVIEKKTDSNPSASRLVEESVMEENASAIIESSPVTETTEGIMKPGDEVEEVMPAKAAEVEEQTLSGTLQTNTAAEIAQVSSEGSLGVDTFEEKKDETSGAAIETAESVDDAATEVSQVEGEKPFGGVEVAEEKNEGTQNGDKIVGGGEYTSEYVDAASEFSPVGEEKASASAEVVEETERMEGENTNLVDTSRNLAAEEGKVTSESMDTATEFSQVEGEKASGGGEVAEEKNETVEEQTSSGTLQTDNAAEFAQVSSEGSAGVEKFEEEKDETSEAIIEPPESMDAATEVSQVEGVKASAEAAVAEENNDRVEGENTSLVETSRNLAVEEGKATSESVDAAAEVSEIEGEKASGGGEVAEVKNETVEGLKATDTAAVDMEDVAHEKDENEKAAEKDPIESAKDGGDTSTELPAKPSQRQSNNLFSKVKQSIVKVKKAIVGKSPNSKATTAEGNDDIKVK